MARIGGREASDAVRYSLESVPQPQRLATWNALSSSIFEGSRIEAPWGGFSQGELIRLPLGDAELVFASSSPARVTRRNASNRDFIKGNTVLLEMVCSGRGRFRVGGRQIILEAGEFMLFDPTDAYYCEFDQPIAVMMATLPTDRAPHRLARLAPFLNTPMRRDRANQRLVSQFFIGVAEDLKRGYTKDWAPALLPTLWGLIDLAYLSAAVPDAAVAHRLALRRAAQGFVERHLFDPELRPSRIVRALDVSARSVQLLFAGMQTTPSRYIRDRRLEVAAERLAAEKDARVGDIALAVGFNDLAYFSRAFRRRFGVSARDYRQGVRPV
jgi:AraC-like DNA-binding protein